MLTEANYIKDQLILQGIPPDIASFATSLAAFETAGFTSKVFKTNNNAFGYKYVGQSIATGENLGYAQYASVKDSVTEFAAYWVRRRLRHPLPIFINTLPAFVTYLKKDYEPGAYFEGDLKKYLAGCEYHFNNLFQ